MTQQRPTSELAEIFDAEDRIDAPGGRFNIAPTDDVAVVVQRDQHRAITSYRWGLIPHWSESARTGNRMFNARAESLDRNPAFRYAFRKRRCLVPVDAFYEWRREGPEGRVRSPFAVVRPDRRPFALAGLWAGWKDESTGEIIRSFTVVTTSANDMMAPIHNRMPVVIPESAWDRWLDPSRDDPKSLGELKGLLLPPTDDWLEAYRVSRLVSNVRNDGPELVEPLEDLVQGEGAEAEGPGARRARTPSDRDGAARDRDGVSPRGGAVTTGARR